MDIISAYEKGMQFLKSATSWFIYIVFAPVLAVLFGILEGLRDLGWLLKDED